MCACTVCWKRLGLFRNHNGDACPLEASLWCSQCSCKGHTALECTRVMHVLRPRFLEDLIPPYVRDRWGIQTQTPIVLSADPTLEEKEHEIAENSVLEVRFRPGKRDSCIREVMRCLDLPTLHKMDDNILKLRSWAVENGKKLSIIQEGNNDDD